MYPMQVNCKYLPTLFISGSTVSSGFVTETAEGEIFEVLIFNGIFNYCYHYCSFTISRLV